MARFGPIRRSLLNWFRRNQRDYPWRKTGNWFHLLMAEMMLRRTRADQVVPVYDEFTRRCETPTDAARLSRPALGKILAPLGLRWRAEQLHDTIHYLRDHYALRAPEPSDDLRDIPGVGEYSEAMLRNRLFGERVAAVDINLVRVISRWEALPFDAETRRRKPFTTLANRFMNSKHARDLNVALLDLSALLCRPVKPACGDCPVRRYCRTGTPAGD